MSELKVNAISGIGDSITVKNPVGIGTPKTGYKLNTDGKINVEGSVEVVTVPATNFGVRIRAPLTATTSPGFGDSTLQFTNNQGNAEWASIHAKTNSSLGIRVNNTERLTIDSAETTRFLDKTQFAKDASFEKASNFANQPPTCPILPTIGNHLANKTYVDSVAKANVQYLFMANGSASAVSKTITLKAGVWVVVFTTCVQFPDPRGASYNAYQSLTSTALTMTNSHYFTKTGDAGHGRSLEVTSTTASQLSVPTSTSYAFQITLPDGGTTTRGATALFFYLG